MNRRTFLSCFFPASFDVVKKEKIDNFDFPIKNYNQISYKMIDESDSIYYFNCENNLLKFESLDYFQYYLYDIFGYEIRYECSDGSWEEYQRDFMTHKVIKRWTSTGFWETFNYDIFGNLKEYNNSEGDLNVKKYLNGELISHKSTFNVKVNKTVLGKNLKRIL